MRQAAEQLHLDPSRVQQLLRGGRLPGRRLGGQWLIDSDAVALLASQVRLPGRPMAASRAWGLLDLLDGGGAPWLAPVARSQVRHQARALEAAGPDRWRAALAARSDVVRAWAHPSALPMIEESAGVLPAGAARAAQAGADLVVVAAVSEIYVRRAAWRVLQERWQIRAEEGRPNLIVRMPRDVWPFEGDEQVGGPALAADLLDSGEPRALSAAVGLLRDRVRLLSKPRSRVRLP